MNIDLNDITSITADNSIIDLVYSGNELIWTMYNEFIVKDINNVIHEFSYYDLPSRKLNVLSLDTKTGQKVITEPFKSDSVLSDKSNFLEIIDMEGLLTSLGSYSLYYISSMQSISADNIQRVESFACEGLEYLTSFSSTNLTALESNAFLNCQKLSVLNVGKIRTLVGTSLAKCYGLSSMTLDDNNTYFYMLDETGTPSDRTGCILVRNSDKRVMWGASKVVKNVVLPEDIKYIETHAFYGSMLYSLDCKNLKSIGSEAFSYNGNLSDFNLYKCESIGENPFYTCRKLSSVVKAEDNNYLSVYDVYGNLQTRGEVLGGPQYETIQLPDGKYIIRSTLLWASIIDSVTDLSIHEGFDRVGNAAIKGSYKLRSVYIPTVVQARSNFCADCTELSSVDIPNIKQFVNSAFYNTPKLKEVHMEKITFPPQIMAPSQFMVRCAKNIKVYVPAHLVPQFNKETNWLKLIDDGTIELIGV